MLLKNKIIKNFFLIFAFTSFILLSTLMFFTLSKNYQTKKIIVPDFAGTTLSEAKQIARTRQLNISFVPATSTLEKNSIISQIPGAGSSIRKGDIIELIVSSGSPSDKTEKNTVELTRKVVTKKPIEIPETPEISEPATSNKKVRGKICIDPGHQLRSDNSLEPIGPGSSILKPKVTQGATGISTKKPEHELVLEISIKLKKHLEDKGFEVLLTRDKADVNISNSQRAKKASDWNADFFIRLHADSSSNNSVKGILTLYPAKNNWSENFYQKSLEWANEIHKAVVQATGRSDRGVTSRSELSGFNWSKVPVILIEMGFLSNKEEDKLLNSDTEQQKIINAISNVIESKFPVN